MFNLDQQGQNRVRTGVDGTRPGADKNEVVVSRSRFNLDQQGQNRAWTGQYRARTIKKWWLAVRGSMWMVNGVNDLKMRIGSCAGTCSGR